MSTAITTVRVNLAQRAYDIEIGVGILQRIGAFVCERVKVSHAVVITDANVHHPYGRPVADSIAAEGANVDLLVIEPGEASKSVAHADQLWRDMLDAGADRKSIVVAAGGGVVGDLAGFVAATYGRGIRFFQVPTSLLAQVDSSVGGKVGINLPGAKNMVGAFWQPRGVLIDVATLQTLEARQYRAGLAEVVKYGVILDAAFFTFLEEHVEQLSRRDGEVLRQVVARCCRLKADVVEADEREESGLRAVLNYGHTFAHAIETVTGYDQLLHGEAVAIGMLCASRLAERLGRIQPELTARQHRLLTALGLPVAVPEVDHQQLLAAMQHDKKVQHGQLHFVLPAEMGRVELVAGVDPVDVEAALGG